MSVKEFRLPDPGEGLTEAEIVSWKVRVGDTVKVNDVVVEIETAKSLVELPVPFAGTVTALLVAEGDTVEVGTPIIAVEVADTDEPRDSDGPAAEQPGVAEPRHAPLPSRHPKGTGREAVLVGYGVKQTEAVRRRRSSRPGPPTAHLAGGGVFPGSAPAAAPAVAAPTEPTPSGPRRSPSQTRALAKPPIRKYAKDLGVDLDAVVGSGPDGLVTRADVETAAGASPAAVGAGPAVARGAGPGDQASAATGPAHLVPTGTRGETREPVKGVRRMMAQAMVGSAFGAPHVTEWVTVDATATTQLVARLKQDPEFRDLKVSPMLVVAKAILLAIRRTPQVNSFWDDAAQEVAVRHYVHLGVAAATPRGLIVPVVKDADTLTLPALAARIQDLAQTAREGRTQPSDTTGGTITLTNIGVFGIDTGTPIINPGESAIVVMGAIRRQPWVVTDPDGGERIEPRDVTTLGMSFDHRHIDGATGSRFLADIAAVLHDPARALVWC